MSELREAIGTEVYDSYLAGIDHNQVPFKYLPMTSEDVAEITDTIIAAFAEAMLSDTAVEAAKETLPAYLDDHEVRAGIEATLQAIGATEEPA